jgi:hypothetical protein
VGEAALAGVEVDGGNALAGLKQGDGDMHRRGRFSRSAFFVAKDDDMRRERLANIRLHQHGTQPLRSDPFSSLQRLESRVQHQKP